MGTGFFLWLKLSRRVVDYPLPSIAEVIEKVELYLYSLSGHSFVCSRVNFTFTFTCWLRSLIPRFLEARVTKKPGNIAPGV
jgi:hypothetical protein